MFKQKYSNVLRCTYIKGVPKRDKTFAFDSLSTTKDSSDEIFLNVNKNLL